MPAINVAKTDTFEIQRQKINEIGDQIFNISQGGSDLATGNLKLGDGTRIAPSLAFTSNPSLGIYKSDIGSIGYVVNGKKLLDINPSKFYYYRDLVLQKKSLLTTGIGINNFGKNYDAGSYENITIFGGTGSDATADISVVEYVGEITTTGSNYNSGNYQSISLIGGSGSGATANIQIDQLAGQITNSGSGYKPGSYDNVSLTGGSGSGATANISIQGSSEINGTISNAGSLYTEGTYSNVGVVNKPTQIFIVTVVSNPNSPPTNVFAINGVLNESLTFIRGNTYRFNVSDSSNEANSLSFQNSLNQFLSPQNYSIVSKGIAGSAGAFVDLVIKPTADLETISYYSMNESGMGGSISIIDGVEGFYGTNLLATITVNSSGLVSNFSIANQGVDYKIGDILQAYIGDVGNTGSGFEFSITSFTYTGEIDGVNIISSGINYNNGDILSANVNDIGGEGSGFQFTVNSDPGKITELAFTNRGIGYSVGDILTLPSNITNVTTTLKGSVSNISSTLSDTSPNITVSSTTGIVEGMVVSAQPTDAGQLSPNTTVLSVNSLTSITLSQNPAASGAANLSFLSSGNLNEIQVNSVQGILVNSAITQTAGSGILGTGVTVDQIDSENNIITLSDQPQQAGSATLTFVQPYGSPTTNFSYTIQELGVIDEFSINQSGNGYTVGDQLNVNSFDLVQPITYAVTNKTIQKITFVESVPSSAFSVGDTIVNNNGLIPQEGQIYFIKTTSNIIDYIIIDNLQLETSDLTSKQGSVTEYTVDTQLTNFRYFIDTGSGEQISPNLTFYVGNTYLFDLADSSNSGHIFALSTYRDGQWSPSLVEDVSTTLVENSNLITVSDTTGILPGMAVSAISGQGALSVGTIVQNVINSTTIQLNNVPFTAGTVVLRFRGTEFTNGIERSDNSLKIKVTEETPLQLYYYCGSSNESHSDEGGYDLEESTITVEQNNPKIFGSDFAITVNDLLSTDSIFASLVDGNLTATKFIGDSVEAGDIVVSGSIESDILTTNSITTDQISSLTNLTINSDSTIFNSNISVSNKITIASTTGNFTTSGELKSTNRLNINDLLFITGNTISASSGNNIQLTPPTGRVAKINTSTALTIPSGTTAQRPSSAVVENGSIRFNTDTGQYEGYSSTSSSWSSLGGVRDLDGNTYITAEESVGSNDNRLWFYNDNINTVRFTTTFQEFVNVKKVRSLNTSAPTNIAWTANAPVTIGQYLKYRNNIYEVVIGGTTGTSGNEPTDITGNNFANGSATLRYFTTAVAPLTFEEISELRIAPNGGTSLSINDDLRLETNTISTDVNDLLLRPNTGKKIIIDATTSLVLPVGDNNERGAPIRGSVRFNTSILQYEGYDGTNWSSLGGVRDVDGNTYIIPETSPGSNQNILYFFNNNSNTLRVTENDIQLDTIDTIVSSSSNTLNIQAQLITFNNLSASIDTSSTSTFLSTIKDNLDFGLSSGLTNDPLLRLSNTGDIYYNLGFGSGAFNAIKLLDADLKEFEIADYKISTTKVNLIKNTADSGSAILYDPAIHQSAKVQIIAHNTITGDKEFVEYSVIDNGSDIFFTDFGNVKTGAELISSTFDFNANNNVRVTFTLDNAIVSGNTIEVTVISNIIKR
jgi:hypothetical protein